MGLHSVFTALNTITQELQAAISLVKHWPTQVNRVHLAVCVRVSSSICFTAAKQADCSHKLHPVCQLPNADVDHSAMLVTHALLNQRTIKQWIEEDLRSDNVLAEAYVG